MSHINRRLVEETALGVRRVRLERSTSHASLAGEQVKRVANRYLDGDEVVTLVNVASGKPKGEALVMAWEAVPARTQDVLDFGRLETAAKALTAQMAAYGPGNPPPAEQVASWLLSFQTLQQWRKAAEERMTAADGQVGTVGTLLRQFL